VRTAPPRPFETLGSRSQNFMVSTTTCTISATASTCAVTNANDAMLIAVVGILLWVAVFLFFKDLVNDAS